MLLCAVYICVFPQLSYLIGTFSKAKAMSSASFVNSQLYIGNMFSKRDAMTFRVITFKVAKDTGGSSQSAI